MNTLRCVQRNTRVTMLTCGSCYAPLPLQPNRKTVSASKHHMRHFTPNTTTPLHSHGFQTKCSLSGTDSSHPKWNLVLESLPNSTKNSRTSRPRDPNRVHQLAQNSRLMLLQHCLDAVERDFIRAVMSGTSKNEQEWTKQNNNARMHR
jgi:hypothetical protein